MRGQKPESDSSKVYFLPRQEARNPRILTRRWFHTLERYVPWNATDYTNARFLCLQWQRPLHLELLSCFRILSSNVNWNRQRGYLPCSQSTDANRALTQVPAQLLSQAFFMGWQTTIRPHGLTKAAVRVFDWNQRGARAHNNCFLHKTAQTSNFGA